MIKVAFCQISLLLLLISQLSLARRAISCYGNGFQKVGNENYFKYDPISNTCYGFQCHDGKRLKEWKTKDCVATKTKTSSTTTATTITTPPSTTTIPDQGCLYDGKHYDFGSSINEGYDESSNWCYGQYCSDDGEVISWDTFDCKTTQQPPSTEPSTTEPATTEPASTTTKEICNTFYPTTEPSTLGTKEPSPNETPITETTPDIDTTITPTSLGCYDDGKFYPAGTDISEGYDESSNWCYGKKCTESGTFLLWDNFSCWKTTPQSE